MPVSIYLFSPLLTCLRKRHEVAKQPETHICFNQCKILFFLTIQYVLWAYSMYFVHSSTSSVSKSLNKRVYLFLLILHILSECVQVRLNSGYVKAFYSNKHLQVCHSVAVQHTSLCGLTLWCTSSAFNRSHDKTPHASDSNWFKGVHQHSYIGSDIHAYTHLKSDDKSL